MNHQYFPISLPSNGRIYPIQDICARPLCGADEVLLAQMSPTNMEQRFLVLLQNVMQGVDPARLTLGDRLYMILWLTISSYTDTLPISYVCSGCFQEVDVEVDLKTMEVITLNDDFKQPYYIKLSDGQEIGLNLLTVNDMVQVERYLLNHEDDHVFKYSLTIDGPDPIEKKMELYQSLPIKDTAKIRAFQEKFFHGPKMTAIVCCPKCQAKEEVVVPFRFEMLFPTGGDLRRYFGERI